MFFLLYKNCRIAQINLKKKYSNVRTTDCTSFLGIPVIYKQSQFKFKAEVWNKDVFPNTSDVLNPIMHKTNCRRQTRLLCVKIFEQCGEQTQHRFFFLSFLHLFL